MVIVNTSSECINLDHVMYFYIDKEGISRNYSSVIYAKLSDGSDKLIERYSDENICKDDFDKIINELDKGSNVIYTNTLDNNKIRIIDKKRKDA